jgi:hypothetical protein
MPTESNILVEIIGFLDKNKDWLFSGVGLATVVFLYNKFNGASADTPAVPVNSPVAVNVSVNSENHNNTSSPSNQNNEEFVSKKEIIKDEMYYKNNTKILIVDDEIKFKLPKILKTSGWVHSKLIKDINNLDDIDVRDADIMFVDVQGVGISLNFKDEGLGLVEAIKDKYPTKKVVIYSVINEGNRFHNAFNVCDGCLSKDADPYQFQKMVEKFTINGGNNE